MKKILLNYFKSFIKTIPLGLVIGFISVFMESPNETIWYIFGPLIFVCTYWNILYLLYYLFSRNNKYKDKNKNESVARFFHFIKNKRNILIIIVVLIVIILISFFGYRPSVCDCIQEVNSGGAVSDECRDKLYQEKINVKSKESLRRAIKYHDCD